MQKAIDILEVEIESIKDAYKIEKEEAIKREYSKRILSCKNAIKILKKDYKINCINLITSKKQKLCINSDLKLKLMGS